MLGTYRFQLEIELYLGSTIFRLVGNKVDVNLWLISLPEKKKVVQYDHLERDHNFGLV